MPSRFTPFGASLWLPANLSPSNATEAPERFRVIGHLKPGIPIEQANADVAVLGKRMAANYPKDILPDMYYGAELFGDFYGSSKTFYIFLGAVGLLLLIACVNVANLLLARASAREKEFAIRASLGAGRRRLVRQLLLESLLLALGGAVLGCLLAWSVLGGLAAFLHDSLPSEAAIQINGPVLLFCLGAALLSTLLFGLVPALQAVRKDLEEPLKASCRGAGQSRRHGKIQNLAVVSEVVLSLVLLTGASLLIRTFLTLHRIEFGFDPQNVLVAGVDLPPERYKTAEQRVLFQTELLRRVRALPGVFSAAFGDQPSPFGDGVKIEVAGNPAVDKPAARFRWAGDGYFETLGVPVLQGRGFSQQDIAHARNVAVINRAFAGTYFGRENPLDRQVKLRDMEMNHPYLGQDPGFEIVGVVGDTVTWCRDYDQCKLETIYVPNTAGMPVPWLSYVNQFLHVRTVGEPTRLLNSVRHEVMAIDKELPVTAPYFGWTLRDMLTNNWYAEPRSHLTLLAAFAGFGLALVCVGLYSVLSYSVSRRTHEIGVRMALGAETTDVRRMVMLSGLRWLAVGIGIGVAVSIGLAKILQNRIWWVKGADPLTLAAAALVLTAVGLAACYFPARRATKVDPLVALRYE
jgi:predicted permease